MKNENMKKNNKGFSLVELIVVIAIMAVLMVILAPAMLRYVEKTRVQKDESAISEAANAAELALGEESIYSAVTGNNSITVTIAPSGITDSITGTHANIVANDVKKTVGDNISFVSKKYKGTTIIIKLGYDATKDAYVLLKSSVDNKPFQQTSDSNLTF